jgi:hypothetical protein
MDPRSRRTALAIGALVVVAGALGAATVLVWPPAHPAATVSLTISEDPATGAYVLSPSSVQVPADSTVLFTIRNFDPFVHPVGTVYCNVTGTMDGYMTYGLANGMGGMMGGGASVRSMPSNGVSHTFTVSGDGYQLNVPIPPAQSPTEPSVVTFTLATQFPGSTTWRCAAMGITGDGDSAWMVGPFTIG